MEGTSACGDCVVTFLCDREPGGRGDHRCGGGARAAVAGRRGAGSGVAVIGVEPGDPGQQGAVNRRLLPALPGAHGVRPHGRDGAPSRAAAPPASTWSRWPSAEPFVEVRRDLEERKAAGLHGGMAFTYRQPARSTDPEVALRDAAALVVGRAELPRPTTPSPASARRSPVAIARYAWEDHYAHLKTGLKAIAGVLKAHGWRARVLADDNAMVDRAAAHRAGIGWWGKNANLLLPGLGQLVRARLRGHRRAASPPTSSPVEDRCGPCRRCLDGCPTGAITAPGVVDARRCLSWLLQAEGSFPIEHRVALGDRIYGCDECQEVCPPNRRAPVRPPTGDERAVGRPRDAARPRRRRGARAWRSRWYIPRRDVRYVRRNALVVLGNVGDGARSRRSSSLLDALPRATPTRCCGATPSGRRAGSDARISSRRSSRRPIPRSSPSDPPPSDDPPVRHQRLPAEGRRDPDDALGAVAAARPDVVRGAHHAVRGRRGLGCRARPYRVVRTKEKVLLPTPSLVRRIDDAGRRDRRVAGGARSRPAGRAGRPTPPAPVRRRAPRRRDHRARPAARLEPRAAPRAPRAPSS